MITLLALLVCGLGGLTSIPITEKSCKWSNKRKPRLPATSVTTQLV